MINIEIRFGWVKYNKGQNWKMNYHSQKKLHLKL